MRHLLHFLHFGKRDDKTRNSVDDERASQPDPASTLIIAGEPVPRGEKSSAPAPAPPQGKGSEPSSRRLEDVVKSKRQDRWQPPELEGPEFGGLIERRGVDTRGLMPQKYEARPEKEHRHQTATKHSEELSKMAAKVDPEGEQNLESTGMFLAALDNSAITLADSGLFKVSEEDEEEAAPDGAINPYNHRGDG